MPSMSATQSDDPDLFRDPVLRFSVRKPARWSFLPPAWSPMEQRKRGSLSDDALTRFAAKPFCCAMGHHDSERHAYPTLQVTARPFPQPNSRTIRECLDAVVAAQRREHPDFQLLDATPDAMLAGHRALRLRATFTTSMKPDEERVELAVLTRVNIIFALNRAYTVGLSGSADPAYYDEEEFRQVLASVRVGG